MKATLFCAAVSACFLVTAALAQAQPAASQKPSPAAGQKAPPVQKTPATAHRKTIGLIAALGQTFTVRRIGSGAFGEDNKQFSVREWKVDERITAQVSALLEKDFNIRRIAVTESAFARLQAPQSSTRDFDLAYQKVVQGLAGAEKADYYLAITPGYSRFGGDEIVFGLGIVQRQTLLSKDETTHCLVLYRLYDAQFNLLRSEGAMSGRNAFADTVIGPHVDHAGKKIAGRDARTAASDPRTEDAALNLLNKDVAATVPKLFVHQ